MNERFLPTSYSGFSKKWINAKSIKTIRRSILSLLFLFCFFLQSFANNTEENTSQKAQSDSTQVKKYKVFDNWLTWTKAKAYCESIGGHLATITSKEEQLYIKSLLNTHPTMMRYWLGGTDQAAEGEWKWITGEKWEYSNWDIINSEPNQYEGTEEDYLQLYNICESLTRGTWNDLPPTAPNNSTSLFGFICEWDTPGIYYVSPKAVTPLEEFTNINIYAYPISSERRIELVKENITIKPDSILETDQYNIKARFSFKNTPLGVYDVLLISTKDTMRLDKGISLIFLSGAIEPTDPDNDGNRNISTFGHLVWIAQHKECWSWNYELDNDIDATETKQWNDGEGLDQITDFSGTFDGQGHKIKFIHITRPDQDYVSLFGKLSSKGKILNLGLTSCNIVGKNYTASFASSNNGGTISNCYCTGKISGNENIGGIVGDNNGSVKFCYNSAIITGVNNIGGLVGNGNSSSVISKSYNIGKVIGSDLNVGGIIGANSGTIKNCYNAGSVIGAGEVAGISGRNYGSVSFSYNRGYVNGTGGYCGAINGYGSGSITNSYWDKQNSGLTTSNGGTGKTATEMKTQSTYTNWDFSETWEILSTLNDGYPQLTWAKTTSLIKSYSPERVANSGSATVTFEGINFDSNTKIYIYKAGQDSLKADTIYTSDTYCTAQFNFNNAALGSWNILVEYPDTKVTIKNGLTIEETKEESLSVSILGPDKVRINRSGSFIVEYKNESNVTVQNVPIWIAVNKYSDVKFKFPILVPNDSSITDLYPYIEIENLKGKEGPFKCYCFNIPYINAYGIGQLELEIKSASSQDSDNNQLFSWIGQSMSYDNDTNLKTAMRLKSIEASTCDLLDFCSKITNYVHLSSQQDCICGEVQGIFKTIPNLMVAESELDRIDDNNQRNWRMLLESGQITEEYYRARTGVPPLENPYHILQQSLDHCVGSTLSKNVVDAIKQADGANYANWPDCLKDPTQHDIIIVSSFDPNDKYGYRSPSGSTYFNEDQTNFTYVIDFENKETASAAAQEVFVTDTLNSNVFDIESFKAGSVKIGKNTYEASFNARDAKWTIDMRPAMNYITYVTLKLDTVTSVAKWYFRCVDPVTLDWPTDPLAGFLPPNDSTGRGQGSVSFSINLKSGLSDEATLNNHATIVFDTNDPIKTPTWTNKKDIVAPTCSMSDPEIVANNVAHLSWSGTDNKNGSGIYCYNLYVKKDKGIYEPFLSRTTTTSTDFEYDPNSGYSFYVTAIDSAENAEVKTNIPEVTINTTDVKTLQMPNEHSVSVLPNPNEGIFTVTTTYEGESQLSVTSISGQKVFGPIPFRQSTQVNLKGRGKGMYLCIVKNSNQVITKKIEIK